MNMYDTQMRISPFIPPASLAFDFDGVIADTMTLFLEIAREEYAIEGIRLADITSYDLEQCLDISPDILHEIGMKIIDGTYRAKLNTMPGAASVLSTIVQCHSPLLFVTARPYPGPVSDWITSDIGLKPEQVELVTTGSFEAKAETLLGRGISYFVEDRLETCFHLSAFGLQPIVFQQPWNRRPHGFIEVDGWPTLGALIDTNGNGCV